MVGVWREGELNESARSYATRGILKYLISAEVTISVHTVVEAESEKEAKEIAAGRSLVELCHMCAEGDEDEEWCVSEFDGEPKDFDAEEYE